MKPERDPEIPYSSLVVGEEDPPPAHILQEGAYLGVLELDDLLLPVVDH